MNRGTTWQSLHILKGHLSCATTPYSPCPLQISSINSLPTALSSLLNHNRASAFNVDCHPQDGQRRHLSNLHRHPPLHPANLLDAHSTRPTESGTPRRNATHLHGHHQPIVREAAAGCGAAVQGFQEQDVLSPVVDSLERSNCPLRRLPIPRSRH